MLKHKHLLVRAEVLEPPKDLKTTRIWLKKLINDIDMKILGGPYLKYCDNIGNRGLTAVTIIETSHIAMHIWDEVSPALMQFDVYSCGDLNVEAICRKIENDFEIRKMEFKFLNREAGLQEISKK